MANMIGYELLTVGGAAIGPTASTVSGANNICAIFYVDPDSAGPVRYRGDAAPTAYLGLPLRPGKHLVVTGKGGIMNALFISAGGGRCLVHACYYDQVDVIAADLGGPEEGDAALLAVLREQQELLELILAEARRRNHLLEILTDEEAPIQDFMSHVV